MPPTAGARLCAEFRVLRAEALELSLLILAGLGSGRGRLVPGRLGLVRLIFTGLGGVTRHHPVAGVAHEQPPHYVRTSAPAPGTRAPY
jgi:hypothetical protein